MNPILANELVIKAKGLVGVAKWKYAAKYFEAPNLVDCSSLTQWLYSTIGITIPRRSHDQMRNIIRRYGLNNARVGDLLFVSSPYVKGRKVDNHAGLHVCLVVSEKNVICATNSELGEGVIEISIENLLRTRSFITVGEPIDTPDISEFIGYYE